MTDSFPKMDRTKMEIVGLHEQKSDRAYWMGRPFEERIEAFEMLRRMYYGEDYAAGGLQRVLEIVEVPPR